MQKFTKHEGYHWIESSPEYVRDLSRVAEVVTIPHNHVGYAEDAVTVSNYRAIEEDPEMIERLNLMVYGGVFGNLWIAVIDDYTEEQFEELNDLIEQLMNYPLLDESLYSEIDLKMATESLEYMREDDYEDVSDHDVMLAIHELGLEIYHEGEGHYHIEDDELAQAVEYAAKQQELETV